MKKNTIRTALETSHRTVCIPFSPWSLPYSSTQTYCSSTRRSCKCSRVLVTTRSEPFRTRYVSSSSDCISQQNKINERFRQVSKIYRCYDVVGFATRRKWKWKHLYWVLQPIARLQHQRPARTKSNVHAVRPEKNCTNNTIKMISCNELFVFWGTPVLQRTHCGKK